MPKENENSKEKKPGKGKSKGSLTKVKKTPKRQVDKIGKSKQLSEKLKTVTPGTTRTLTTKSKDTEPRLCGNGKPMPSLAELERMFDDDSDEENLPAAPAPARCTTPDQPIPAADQALTPRTLQQLSNKMLDIISNLPDATILIEDGGPPPPIVPQMLKRKKNGTPYIVGCKERAKVVKKPKCTIGKGDSKYGVNYNINLEDESDDEIPLKRKKRGTGTGNMSKSIFNPQAEEIAAQLRAAEKNEVHSDGTGSVDSNKTVNYEFSSLSPNSKARSFSPLPSTSNDKETILKNDIRLNESFLVDSNCSHDEVEIIEMPCETVIVDDVGPDEPVPVLAPDVEEVKHTPPAPAFDSFIDLDSYQYSSIVDIDESFASDDCQIIDVDDVIAENQLIIDKYSAIESNTVTQVQLNENSKNTVTQVQLNENSTKEQPTTVDLVQTSEPKKTNCDSVLSIESVVNNFFQNRAVENTVVNLCSPTNSKTIDLSTGTGVFNDSVESVMSLAKSLLNSLALALTTQRRKNDNPRVVHTSTNLDQSSTSVYSNDCVTYVSTSVPDNRVPNQPSTPCVDIGTNSNTVIIHTDIITEEGIATAPIWTCTCDNCLKGDYVTTSRPPKKKSEKKKAKVVPVAASATATARAPESPKGRSIGECPICMENLSNSTVASTICGHVFCMTCLQAAIKASGKRCPTCRKVLRGASGYHQIFL